MSAVSNFGCGAFAFRSISFFNKAEVEPILELSRVNRSAPLEQIVFGLLSLQPAHNLFTRLTLLRMLGVYL
jgi:hypothetical protein